MNNGVKTAQERELEAARKIDPGPAPWCPNCGASASTTLAVPRGPGFENKQSLGVCTVCASICKPEGEHCPFLFHVSDLRPGIPAPVLDVQRQVRAKLRSAS